ncbi:uncharacterized protein MONBRDRAFT_34561 [Monosiga brevicollis MX1]|uniref:ethanolamine kinase n=1 Tax=Monosiga brevicollis TaxID=81824 RepID=A9VCJ6_MONBE|nr:uncharacterized protein MONBRDRAFT_34561 [Monosiga brevicollis MX1]EDQ84797.1 predicted protein [Monosiga brevicollis MX1]|eukprot:XP_001750447.1 hypothetical protein [Monosiga brevicollis MX1]
MAEVDFSTDDETLSGAASPVAANGLRPPRPRRRKSSSRQGMRHIDIYISPKRPSLEASRLLTAFFGAPAGPPQAHAALSHHTLPVSRNYYRFSRLTDGITNVVLKCTQTETRPESPHPHILLMRIYGDNTERLIDREAELTSHELLASQSLAMPLYGSFLNGYVYGYMPGDVCSSDQLADENVAIPTAQHLALFHRTMFKAATPSANVAAAALRGGPFDLSAGNSVWLATVRQWLTLQPAASVSDPRLQAEFAHLTDSLLVTLTNQVVEACKPHDSDLVICHNDLLAGNILRQEDGSVRFIDYEYCGANPRAYDFANHFNEYCGLGPVDFGKYPSVDAQRRFVEVYADALGGDMLQTPESREAFLASIEAHRMASHLLWSIWSLLQATSSQIEFDYVGYAHERITELQRLLAGRDADVHVKPAPLTTDV